ncbi:hypothetical protein K493DRAFT_351031 [Basidiobolus meristosporus CBS 931.73]|uniref:ARM repeat-containing protein n=1 Tax=Basidiobolus meristosporus CBS 931.73 TaxID=1314790 RepID=A0A1Y1YDS0_9FUNG|nr:hypothetical protein K493DRAFT_351031 [Basidiobolus meristosporus CBS 931.73]|eukprot:ORX96139.1 hypothetical protein K493DRAFT_351031 [Basidiobolus meristosporus CBS 931.73]
MSEILLCLEYLIENCFEKMDMELKIRLFLITVEFLGEKSELQSKTLGVPGLISEEVKLQAARTQAPFFFNQRGREQLPSTPRCSGFFLYTESGVPQPRIQLVVARVIHTFIHCIKAEKLLDLRLVVLRNLNQFISGFYNMDILAQFFPGIFTGLSSIILDNIDCGNSRLLVGLLNALENAIVGALNDEINSSHISEVTSLEQLGNSPTLMAETTDRNITTSTENPSGETSQKDTNWINAAQAQTKTLLIKVLRTRSHLDWKVRNACLKLCFNTLSQCHRILSSCFSILIETLVLGLNDSYSEIVSTATEYIEMLLHHPDLASLVLLHSKQNFYNLIDSLPSTLTRHDELVKYSALSLCAAYLQIISRDIDEFLSTNFNKFVSSLLPSLELDYSDIQLLETRAPSAYDAPSRTTAIPSEASRWTWMPTFLNIHEDRTAKQLSMMFRSFGYYGNVVSLMDKLLSNLRSTRDTKYEVVYIFIINELLHGAQDRLSSGEESSGQHRNVFYSVASTDDDLRTHARITKSVSRAILREYMSRWNNESIEEDSPDTSTGDTPYEYNGSLLNPRASRQLTGSQSPSHYTKIHEILTIKSVLYGTARVASILDREFRRELLDVLYPLMEMMGHDSTVLYDSATYCAETIRVCCQYSSVQNMIAENADYLVNAMSHKFAFSSAHSQVPHVLRAFLCILGAQALPLIEDMIDDILDTLDNNREHYDICSQLLAALDDFLGLTLEVIRSSEGQEGSTRKVAETRPSQFDNFLAWYRADAEDSDLLLETLYTSGTPDSKPNQADPSTSDTDQSRVSMMITQKSILYLTAKTAKMRSLATNILAKGLKIVGPSDTYTLINDAWPSLYHLLESKESMLVFKTVRLIQEIAEDHAEFASKRFVSQIWPYFSRLFTANRSQLRKRHSLEPSFHVDHRESQKLLVAVLEATSTMLLHLSIPIRKVRSICEAVAPVAMNDSDPQVQQAISQVFSSVARRFPDVFWVFINSGDGKAGMAQPPAELKPIIKTQQKRLESILNARRIPFVFIDVAASTAAKNYMRNINPTPTVVLPQIFVDGSFRGFFRQFEEANDRDELTEFLGFDTNQK